MEVNREEFPIEVRHAACGGVAFYRKPGRVLLPHMVAFPPAPGPVPFDRVWCASCRRIARTQDLISVWPGRCVYCGAEIPRSLPGVAYRRWCSACLIVEREGL